MATWWTHRAPRARWRGGKPYAPSRASSNPRRTPTSRSSSKRIGSFLSTAASTSTSTDAPSTAALIEGPRCGACLRTAVQDRRLDRFRWRGVVRRSTRVASGKAHCRRCARGAAPPAPPQRSVVLPRAKAAAVRGASPQPGPSPSSVRRVSSTSTFMSELAMSSASHAHESGSARWMSSMKSTAGAAHARRTTRRSAAKTTARPAGDDADTCEMSMTWSISDDVQSSIISSSAASAPRSSRPSSVPTLRRWLRIICRIGWSGSDLLSWSHRAVSTTVSVPRRSIQALARAVLPIPGSPSMTTATAAFCARCHASSSARNSPSRPGKSAPCMCASRRDCCDVTTMSGAGNPFSTATCAASVCVGR